MSTRTLRRPPGSGRPSALVCVVVAILLVALGGMAVVLVARTTAPDEQVPRALLELLIVGVPGAAGLYALRTQRTARFGMVLIAAAVAWALTSLGETDVSVLYSVGRVSAWLIFPPLIYLMLAFPDGRLATRPARLLFVAITVLELLLYVGSALLVDQYPTSTPWATCVTDCPANAFQLVTPQPAIVDGLLIAVRESLAGALLLATGVVLVARWKRAAALRRRTLTPLVLTSLFSTLTLIAFYVVRGLDHGADAALILGSVWALSLPAAAGGFLIALLRRRARVGDILTRLSLAIAEPMDVQRLRERLADELGDPDFEILIPDLAPARWRDTTGNVATRADAIAKGLAATHIGGGIVLVHHLWLRDDEDLFDAISALVLTTVEHERMVSRLAGSLAELEGSRMRIARIADLERSRIERDLHDGAQQRLIGLRIKISLAEELGNADPARSMRSLHELGDEVERALEDLRSLAHGVYPSLLTDRGLVDALTSAVSATPLPVRFATHRVTRHQPELETAVYFTCLEAIQNAVKHATSTTGIWMSLSQADTLAFDVRDDGPGFTPRNPAEAGGLRNMRDRIEAVGGHLTVDSAPGQGTRISGSIPLKASR